MASAVRLVDAQYDFSSGVDSGKVPTIASDLVPNGLKRSQTAWMGNATCRGGGVMQRTGWKKLCRMAAPRVGLFQGGYMYEQDIGDPYVVVQIAGRIYRCRVDTDNSVEDITGAPANENPASVERVYFTQAEKYLIIQAGDYGITVPPTLPLFWDNATMRRSIGITTNAPTQNPGINELPAATAMDYYMGRVWYAQLRNYSAGDIVQGPSGTLANQFRDAVLNVTESPLCFNGDGFTVPDNAGNIRAISHAATLDTALGQGPLFVFTRKNIYKLTVPVDRASWIATTTNAQPAQTLAQKTNGTYSDRSVTPVNGDLFFQSVDGIRSLNMAIRYFDQWGNISISNNENRALQFNDRSLMRFCSGIEFDNRVWQTCLPKQTAAGVVFQGIIPLDFDLISSLDSRLPPAWEGMYEGLDVLQMWQGDFGGLQRAFAAVVSREDGGIDLWEFTLADRTDTSDTTDNRVIWFFESPGYTFQKDMDLKKLDGGEIWLDKLFCNLDIEVAYRVDADPCWQFWHRETICTARSTCEDVNNPTCYPEQPYRESYRMPITLPTPPFPACESANKRPMNVGFQFQVRIALKGWARVRGLVLYGTPVDRAPFGGLNC